jgi:PAT family beta-lactamase induction signal transducer AmpG
MSEAVILPIAQRIGWNHSYMVFAAMMIIGLTATLLAQEPAHAEAALDARERANPLSTARGLFDAIAGPFIAFFKAHGGDAILMLVAISLFQLPNFVSGPMYNPMYSDIGLSKDMIGAVRGSFGLVGVFAGVAAGGFLSVRLGLIPALMIGGLGQIGGTMLYAAVPYAHDPISFSLIMVLDNFGIAMAGVTLIAYMSSLTSLGYTAAQYALLSSVYALAGKFLKGFSGLTVDAMAQHLGRMDAYVAFFLGCGAIGVPSLLLFALLERRRRKALEPALSPG